MKKMWVHLVVLGVFALLFGIVLGSDNLFLAKTTRPIQNVFAQKKEDLSLKITSSTGSTSSPQATSAPTATPVFFNKPPQGYQLPQSHFIAQTFNNCGPASLSMVLSMFGTSVSQDVLASKMRPFNNPAGGVDDKSIFADEFVKSASEYGYMGFHRFNGNTELLKKLIANDIPVVVRTYLNSYEDIGHFRIVRGYDDTRQVLIQDDSYQGPSLEYSYAEFDSLWKPFNYGYIVIYPKDKQDLVKAILGDEFDEKVALKNSITRAEKELEQGPNSVYSKFNLSTANYHLGNYQKAAEFYEQVEYQVPPRTMWYQLEPIETYLKLKNYDRVWAMTDSVLASGNPAYSEMYYYRGKVLEARGDLDGARQAFETALYYNEHYVAAKKALQDLSHG